MARAKSSPRAASGRHRCCLASLDDRSRLVCHLQWYWGAECAQNLVHTVSQAFMRRGLPRSAMSDNGPAMVAKEVGEGLARLGILHETTLPYSPAQNGKIENLWAQVEGRLMAMLEDVPDLTLAVLNEATQAWAELEYNRKIHSETGQTPLDPMVGRSRCDAPQSGQRSAATGLHQPEGRHAAVARTFVPRHVLAFPQLSCMLMRL